ncbi:MAG TPA: MarR family transcriptional regulator [Clostridia bacterium]|nr:MarR family transcriptional regulator [Clostridia bacterium]
MSANTGEASLRYRTLLQVLRTADAILDASRVFFARWDLSPSQFNVLNLLRLSPDGLSQTDLSRLLIVHRSNVTGLVDRLEKHQLVERKEVAADRRAYRVVLTPKGGQLLAEILPHYYKGAERVWSELTDRRAAELIDQLDAGARKAQLIAKEMADQT